MTSKEALELVTRLLTPTTSVSPLEIMVFERSWDRQDYNQMEEELRYQYSYIKDVGAKLWKKLSVALGTPVTKPTLHEALARYVHQQTLNKSASLQCNCVDCREVIEPQFRRSQAQLATLEECPMQQDYQLVAISSSRGDIEQKTLATQLAQQLADMAQFEPVVWVSQRQALLLTELMSAIAHRQLPQTAPETAMRQLPEQ